MLTFVLKTIILVTAQFVLKSFNLRLNAIKRRKDQDRVVLIFNIDDNNYIILAGAGSKFKIGPKITENWESQSF